MTDDTSSNSLVDELKLVRLHPDRTDAGCRFNVQRNGQSGLWVECENAGPLTRIVFGNVLVRTAYGGSTHLTALVGDGLLQDPGDREVYLIDPCLGESNRLTFEVASTHAPAPRPTSTRREARSSIPALPEISVIIPTFQRATLLETALESLIAQTLSSDRYEIVVVDDGSTDETADVCRSAATRLRLTYRRIDRAGISAAKNAGLAAARGTIVVFADDDNVADPSLLMQHLLAHRRYPAADVAVLGYVAWRPTLEVTPLMTWLTEIGQWLVGYRDLIDGQILDFRHFFGGCSSSKRSFLLEHGGFDERFRFSEDMELGFRLWKKGLKVIFNRQAVSYMVRPVTYDEFWQRCERQGRGLFMFGEVHPDPEVQEYCNVASAERVWQETGHRVSALMRRIREIEAEVGFGRHAEKRPALLDELWDVYSLTFAAARAKGVLAAQRETLRHPSV